MAGEDALFDEGLFAAQAEERAAERLDVAAPLAVRMRPASLDEVVGQEHVIAPAPRCAGWWRVVAARR